MPDPELRIRSTSATTVFGSTAGIRAEFPGDLALAGNDVDGRTAADLAHIESRIGRIEAGIERALAAEALGQASR